MDCLLTASIADIAGDLVSGFVLTAVPSRPFFNGNQLITQNGVRFRPASGNLSFSLPQSGSSGILISFFASWTAQGIYQQMQFYPAAIPNAASANLSSLLVPVPSF